MSIKVIEDEIRRFLFTEEPEVLCITGHWGIGKTFAWNRYVKNAQIEKRIALKRYSYVSLFGLNSLDELKYSIFENSVNSRDIGIEPSLETLQSNTAAAAKRLGRKSLSFIQGIPLLKNYVGGLGPVWFLSVSRTVICIDDIERRGGTLRIRDVLGLISNLKEFKRCKVCLILNDEAIHEGEDKNDFEMYFDKVVDTSLKFAPSANESVSIALAAGTKAGKLLGDACIKLDISNIRLIKRIERCVVRVESILEGFDEEVLKQAASSLALLGWSVYEPARAPSLDYLQKRRGVDYLVKDKSVPEDEAAWNALLDKFGFSHMDSLDLVLLEGVRNGYFDPQAIKKYASELEGQIKATKLDQSFWQAWEMFHDSFDNNQEEVLNAMYESFVRGVRNISPLNMNSTVALFKQLGRLEQADEMIHRYVEVHGDKKEFFDIHNFRFGTDITDPDVMRAFDDKYASFEAERDPVAILRSMAETNGWSPEDITTLSHTSVDRYYEIFKNTRGGEISARPSTLVYNLIVSETQRKR